MHENSPVARQKRDQMLQLVARGFYNELVNYGVEPGEVVRVASHLLDNLLNQGKRAGAGIEFFSGVFTLKSVRDEWQTAQRLGVGPVGLVPLDFGLLPKVAEWLGKPGVRESFVPAFPDGLPALKAYFGRRDQQYFTILFEGQPVGIVGGEHIDSGSGKLEMKKLVGEEGLHGKGIGKRATFAFLYFAFEVLGLHKVYVHSRDINIRNLNLNSRFGFELEGVFLEDICEGGARHDVVRMALLRPMWSGIFGDPA